MNTSAQIAILFNKFAYGGNYTGVSLKQVLEDITWEQSIIKVKSFNTISTLVFHIDYYIATVSQVLEGGPLEAQDSLSFAHSPIKNSADWNALKSKLFKDINSVSTLLEKMNNPKFNNPFGNGAYGSTLRNVIGLLEHSHYHLGQIVLLKKLI